MSVKDTINPSPVTNTPVTRDTLAGPDAELFGIDPTLSPQERHRILKERRSLDNLLQGEKKSSEANLFALLLMLFLGEKLEKANKVKEGNDKDDTASLAENSSFLRDFSATTGVSQERLKETIRDVRSGKIEAREAAQSTFATIAVRTPPSSIDVKSAENIVSKYAAKGHPILEMIASKESGGNYNVAYNGTAKGLQGNFTNMTVNQVLEWQKEHLRQGHKSTAVGKYQIISTTLQSLKNDFAKRGENIGGKLFDEAMQEKLGMALLERRGYRDYLQGKLPEDQFMTRLSQEWAALPKDMGGKSFYHGDGLNKAHISPAIMLTAMRTAKSGDFQSPLQAQFAKGGTDETQKPPNGLTATHTHTVATGGRTPPASADASTAIAAATPIKPETRPRV